MPDPAVLTEDTPSDADYEQDYHAWLLDTARLLREGRLSEIDVEHIAEELQDMGNSERRAVESFLRLLMLHLLKWRHQPARRGASWAQSIGNARFELEKRLVDSPSLRPRLAEFVARDYTGARKGAAKETGLDIEAFPPNCPFTIEQMLNDDYWPD